MVYRRGLGRDHSPFRHYDGPKKQSEERWRHDDALDPEEDAQF